MLVSLKEAVKILLAGDLVAIPTETVYGLAALYQNVGAVQKIYQLKNRPPENPLILHLSEGKEVLPFVSSVPASFYALADKFWPGPLTLVVPIIPKKIPKTIRAGLPTQAFRVPDHPLTLELLKQVGPVVAPSANLSGRPSSVSPEHVETDFGKKFPVLDGGVCQKGVESTILVLKSDKWHLGRLGAIPSSAFEPLLGYIPERISSEDPLICPGQRFRHYAPLAKLHLTHAFEGAITIIGFSDRKYPEGAEVIRWGASYNPEEVLARLYETLRALDKREIKEAWIDVDFPENGLWSTLRERLKKASGI